MMVNLKFVSAHRFGWRRVALSTVGGLAAGITLLGAPPARAGVVISNVGSNLFTVNEGSSTQFFISVSLTSPSTNLDGWSGTLSYGDGTTGSIGGTFFTHFASKTWADDGVFGTSFSGTGSGYYNSTNPFSPGRVYQPLDQLSATLPFITVLNVAPTITSITGDLAVDPGETFAFSATASDPGVLDVLTYAWDFSGGSSYSDFSGQSGTWSFSQAGQYTVNLRVSDGDGGFAYDSFSVNVVPEPASLAVLAISGLTLLNRRKKRS